MRAHAAVLLFVAFASIASSHAVAAIVTVPSDLHPGDQYRLVYVTGMTMTGRPTDITDYNNFVNFFANAHSNLAALGSTWTVIGSTATVNAEDNTNTNPTVSTGVPIYNLAGALVAANYAALWSTATTPLVNPIEVTELGTILHSSVFTGTLDTGVSASQIFLGGGFMIVSGQLTPFVAAGSSGSTDTSWATGMLSSGTAQEHFYGISGILTVVPEPNCIALVVVGLVGLAAWGWRQKR